MIYFDNYIKPGVKLYLNISLCYILVGVGNVYEGWNRCAELADPPSILLTYGSMSTSCRCWWVSAWKRRRVESSRMDTHTPSPIHASCRTWLSLRGCASNDF